MHAALVRWYYRHVAGRMPDVGRIRSGLRVGRRPQIMPGIVKMIHDVQAGDRPGRDDARHRSCADP
jgi:hypothetical protein